jgi:glutamate-ammonia-ligase adenylyltransferase
MALTRARPVAGDAALLERARGDIAAIIARPRQPKKIIGDVLDMRTMVEEAKGGEGAWDLKQAPGGLVDIEFLVQTLQLLHAAKHPGIVSTETEKALEAEAEAGLLGAADADVLLPALRLYQSLIQMLRLSTEGVFDPANAPRGFLERLARTAELPDFATLDAHVRSTEASVREIFERIIGPVGDERKK